MKFHKLLGGVSNSNIAEQKGTISFLALMTQCKSFYLYIPGMILKIDITNESRCINSNFFDS